MQSPTLCSVTVRRADLPDLDALAPLFDAYRQFQGRAGDLPAGRAFLHQRLLRAESVVFAAGDGATMLGFAQLYPSFSSVSLARVFILNDLFVHAAGRRRGIASGLLAAVEDHAWSAGAVRVTLNVAIDNTIGQALYAARGWKRDAEFFMYHRFASPG